MGLFTGRLYKDPEKEMQQMLNHTAASLENALFTVNRIKDHRYFQSMPCEDDINDGKTNVSFGETSTCHSKIIEGLDNMAQEIEETLDDYDEKIRSIDKHKQV